MEDHKDRVGLGGTYAKNHSVRIGFGGLNAEGNPWLTISWNHEDWTTSSTEDEVLVTRVEKGDRVHFSVYPGHEAIIRIDEIINNSKDGFDIFSIHPTASNNFIGTIDGLQGIETYSIKYTYKGKQYIEDPKMRMI